jgi:hypothetical protein
MVVVEGMEPAPGGLFCETRKKKKQTIQPSKPAGEEEEEKEK